jgi:hypothetical protein
MADKNMGITVTGDISDVAEQLNNLIDLIVSIPDNIIEITADITDAETDIKTVEGEIEDIPDTKTVDVEVNTEGTEEVKSQLDDTAESAKGLGESGALASAGMAAGIMGIIDSAGSYSDQMSRIGTAQDGLVESTKQVADKWGSTMSGMSESTGRAGGVIRKTLADFGVIGVHSSETITEGFKLMSGAAFNTGQDIGTVEQAYTKVVQTGTLGNRQMKALGIDQDDVFRRTGLTMDQVKEKMKGMNNEQRAAFLNMLMNSEKNQAGVEAYKVSWEHTKEEVGRAIEYIARILGALLLPVATIVLGAVSKALEFIANTLNGLDGPLGNAVKFVLGLVLAFGLLVGAIATLQFAYSALGLSQILVNARTLLSNTYMVAQRIIMAASAFQTLGLAGAIDVLRGSLIFSSEATAINTGATELNTAAQNQGIIATVRGYAERAIWTAYHYAAAVASGVLTGAQWLLNAAMSANPIGLVVIAIVALIAALTWAYYNITPVRNAIDGLWKLITGFWAWMTGGAKGGDIWGWLWKTLQTAINLVFLPFTIMRAFVNAIIGWLTGGAGSEKIWDWLWKGLKMAFDLVFLPFTLGRIFIQGIIDWLSGGAGASKIWDWIWKGISDAFGRVYKFFNDLATYLINLPKDMQKWGGDIILGLINGIINAIPGLREALSALGLNFPQSPPKEGPLAKITPDGFESWGTTLVGGLSKGVNGSIDTINKALGSVNSPVNLGFSQNAMNAISNPNGGSSTELNITVDLTGLPAGTTKVQAEQIGNGIGEGLATNEALRGLITAGGKVGPLARK